MSSHPQVRALCVTSAGLVTTSRDSTAKIWAPAAQDANVFECKATLVGHTSYVTCAAPLPASGALVTGTTLLLSVYTCAYCGDSSTCVVVVYIHTCVPPRDHPPSTPINPHHQVPVTPPSPYGTPPLQLAQPRSQATNTKSPPC